MSYNSVLKQQSMVLVHENWCHGRPTNPSIHIRWLLLREFQKKNKGKETPKKRMRWWRKLNINTQDLSRYVQIKLCSLWDWTLTSAIWNNFQFFRHHRKSVTTMNWSYCYCNFSKRPSNFHHWKTGAINTLCPQFLAIPLVQLLLKQFLIGLGMRNCRWSHPKCSDINNFGTGSKAGPTKWKIMSIFCTN